MDLLHTVKKKPPTPYKCGCCQYMKSESELNDVKESTSGESLSPLKALLHSNEKLKDIISSRVPYASKRNKYYGWRPSSAIETTKSSDNNYAAEYGTPLSSPPKQAKSCSRFLEQNSFFEDLFEEIPPPKQNNPIMQDYNTQLQGTIHVTSIIFPRRNME